MKRITLLTIVSFMLFLISCNDRNEDQVTGVNLTSIDLSDLDLNLNLELGKPIALKKENLADFVSENFNEIIAMDKDLSLVFTNTKNDLKYSIESKETFLEKIKEENNKLQSRNDPPGFYDDKVECTKCRNEECVKKALGNAVGAGDEEVIISVTPNYTLGVQTSVSICHGTKEAFLNEWAN
ncbi:hypothetical protein [uncultured Tenacibaculum sp.]|uniref:hypothetical protein n=1 Tax=uncultured Tenacibaculum sp. TaxID=174713 RepID=UPI002630FF31|nr:hypothetical protein [uncultured Tenacibaculum sp.]